MTMDTIVFSHPPDYVVAQWRDGRLLNGSAPVKWDGADAPPELGARVMVTMNNMGPATVMGYFVKHGWLGIVVRLQKPPAWWLSQNPRRPLCHVFGPEFRRA